MRSSSCVRTRPITAFTPSVSKKFPETSCPFKRSAISAAESVAGRLHHRGESFQHGVLVADLLIQRGRNRAPVRRSRGPQCKNHQAVRLAHG